MTPFLLLRVYTGLDLERWSVSSTPAILKLVERLEERAIPATVLFMAKRSGEASGGGLRRTDFGGRFRHVTLYVSPYRAPLWLPGNVGLALNWLLQFAVALRLLRARRDDVVYVDRGNLAYAACLALMGRRVLWRCLGVATQFYRSQSRRLGQRVLFVLDSLFLRTPIGRIVCTLDGSPWHRIFRSPAQRQRLLVLLNGVDRPSAEPAAAACLRARYGLPDGVPVIFSVGRLASPKKVMEILAALRGLARRGHSFAAVIGGYGPLARAAERFIQENGLADRVLLAGRIPHQEVGNHFAMADIVLSLSQLGALSNTTLEGMAAGACVVVLESESSSGIDRATDILVPPAALCRIGRDDIAASLEATLSELLGQPEVRARYKAEALEFAGRHLKSWQERLDLEIDVMSSLLENAVAYDGHSDLKHIVD